VCGTALILNTIAVAYGSLAAVPFLYIVAVVLIWALVSLPLSVLGTILGRRAAAAAGGAGANPCRVKRIPSPIPLRPWYLRPPALALAGGLLPFGSVFIEAYFVFTSLWNYKVRVVSGWGCYCVMLLEFFFERVDAPVPRCLRAHTSPSLPYQLPPALPFQNQQQ
jgi:transmembrane 9 superfamily protein 3